LSFLAAAWLFVESETEVRVLFTRAKDLWRAGNHEDAIHEFESIYRKYPKSSYARPALWEAATIYYFNLYDIGNALYSFEKLTGEEPGNEHRAEAHLKLAEIYELEMNEISKAIVHWNEVLKLEIAGDSRRQVHLKLADAFFKTNRVREALYHFALIIADGRDKHRVEQARIRVGSIFQIQKKYERSIFMFEKVLEGGSCPHCRLQAQLGLIESYEHLDRLPEAIEVAQSINESGYPAPMRSELLGRLAEKRKYYEPRLWNPR
jgi:tetratricopeptide (TPR) repeat protein